MKKNVVFLFLAVCQFLAASPIQLFYPGTYQNPAKMHPRDSTLVGGTLFPIVDMHMKGTMTGLTGPVTDSIKYDRTLGFPYMLVEQRFTDWLVAGLDISNPLIAYIFWPVDGFQALYGVNAAINSYQVSPKVSIKLTDNLYIGGTFSFLELYRAELNYATPTLGGPSFVQNSGTGQGYGGAIGLWYNWGNRTFFDLSYFSQINTTIKGYSVSGTATNTNMQTNRIAAIPHTIILNVAHIFNSTFSGGFNVAYSLWNTNKELTIYNTALGPDPFTLILDWNNTFNVNGFAKIQIVPKFSIHGLVGYDQSQVKSIHNAPILPLGHIWYGGAGAEYQFNPSASFKFTAGQGRQTSPKIQSPEAYVDASNKALYTWIDISSTMRF